MNNEQFDILDFLTILAFGIEEILIEVQNHLHKQYELLNDLSEHLRKQDKLLERRNKDAN